MSAVLAVNIGYSPRHASLPPESRPVRRRLRRTIVAVCVPALFSAGGAYAALRVADQPDQGSATGPKVHVFSPIGLGLREPAGMAGAGHHLWITNSAGNSVTELGWRRGEQPIVRRGSGSRFLAPGAITSGHGHLWIADLVANAITELRSGNGTVVRTIDDVAAPHSLVLFANRLWVTNPGSNAVLLINARTGEKVRVFRHNGFAYPSALAVSHRLLWVANEGKNTITVMDAVTGAWKGTLRGKRFRLRQPIAEVAGRRMLWVGNARGHSITQINTITRKLVRIIAGRSYHLGCPGAMALADGKLWVLNTAGNSVTEINAATGRRVAVLAGALYRFHRPTAIAAYHHAIWVASASSVTRISLPLGRKGSAQR